MLSRKPTLKIKRLSDGATVPSFAHDGDAGLDLHASEDILIAPKERKAVPLGLAFEIPKGYAGLIWDRSGLALKEGLTTLAGVVDAGYRGEVKVILYNTTDQYYQISRRDRIAQMLIQKVEQPKIEAVSMLDETQRGEGGFGSSGK